MPVEPKPTARAPLDAKMSKAGAASPSASATATTTTFQMNPPELDGVPDMASLIYLDEPNILHNVRCRFAASKIYTNMANILIAVNPYKQLKIYGPEFIKQYAGVKASLHHRLEPHVYAVSEAAYANVMQKGENQSMIVCGESGSGKTESAKLLMRHLAYTTQGKEGAQEALESGTMLIIEQQVLAANPILESIGNAKTAMNNNSSRFGKFTKLLFQGERIVGSYIETYLLEKSRIVRQDHGERNYHIFYQLIAGLDDAAKAEFGLTEPQDYHILAQSGCVQIDGVSDHGRFVELQSAMDTLMFSKDTQRELFQLVAGLLHLSNIQFGEDEQSHARIEEPHQASLERAAGLFGLSREVLETRLTSRTIKVGGEVIAKALSVEDAERGRDAMIKSLYHAMFQFVVANINDVLYSQSDSDGGDISELLWIGILDVFGFESFFRNSFEQFCINFANERLQNYFNEHIIKSEQVEYIREGIFWTPIEVPDNNATIDLIDSKPQGVLALLDSACLMPNATHETFTQNLFDMHAKHPSLRRVQHMKQQGARRGSSRIRLNGFGVLHYAGEVIYDANGFLVKNDDSTHEDTVTVFCKSEVATVAELLRSELPDPNARGGRRRRRLRSVGAVFSRQLSLLMTQLQSTQPFFVRCINPNNMKKPDHFVDDYVVKQLRCGGLVEALRILKLGYPTRAPYKQIYARYGKILGETKRSINERDFTEAVLSAFDLVKEDYQLGLTKVFFKPNKQEFMERILRDTKGPLDPALVDKIKKYLIKKRIMRLAGTMKAYARFSIRLRRMRAAKRLAELVAVADILAGRMMVRVLALQEERAAVTMQAALRTLEQSTRLRTWIAKKHAAWELIQMFRRTVKRRTLVREIEKRIDAKRTEAEKAARARDREAREAAEAARRAEEDKHRKLAAYFPSPPSKQYDKDGDLGPIVAEVGRWLAKTNGETIDGDLFDAMQTGRPLVLFAKKLDDECDIKLNKNAKAGNMFAREHLSNFIDWAADQIPEEQVFRRTDLTKFKRPKAVLNTLLNLMFVACNEHDFEPSDIIRAEIEALEDAPTSLHRKIERHGISFFDDDGNFASAKEKAERAKREDEERERREEEEERKRIEEQQRDRRRRASLAAMEEAQLERQALEEEDTGMNENHMPREPARKPKMSVRQRRQSVHDQEEGFFCMTTAAVLRSLEEQGLINPDEWKGFSASQMYQIARAEHVPWHEWHDWIRDRVLAALHIANLDGMGAPESALDKDLEANHPDAFMEQRARSATEMTPKQAERAADKQEARAAAVAGQDASEEELAERNRLLREQLLASQQNLEHAMRTITATLDATGLGAGISPRTAGMSTPPPVGRASTMMPAGARRPRPPTQPPPPNQINVWDQYPDRARSATVMPGPNGVLPPVPPSHPPPPDARRVASHSVVQHHPQHQQRPSDAGKLYDGRYPQANGRLPAHLASQRRKSSADDEDCVIL